MPDELDRLRAEIDDIDEKLVELLRARMAVASQIGAYKREHGLPVLAAEREQAVLDKIRTEAGPELSAYMETVFHTIMACSRDAQKRRCGLIGMPLAHSFSPAIHAKLADYDYKLYELTEEQLGPFLKAKRFDGVNVTIPYKKTAMAYCDELTEQARHVGCVNTIVRRADGSLLGHNTDYDGFCYLLGSAGVEIRGKKAIILGTGGASSTVQAVLHDLGAAKIVVVSRHGETNYENLYAHSDAQLLVNATPVGMYPNTGVSPVELARLPGLKCVLDVVYNPAKTQLLLDAEKLGLQTANGLGMLVAQAKAAAEYFTGRTIDDAVVDRIRRDIERSTKNILLIGMPGCGKTTVGRALAEATGREFVDLDELVTARAGRSIPEIFDADGEDAFRALEHEVLCDTAKRSGLVIACGGGIVTRGENLDPMRQNATVVWLLRDIDKLPTNGRPLSRTQALETLYQQREPLYRAAADLTADNNGSVDENVRKILEAL